MQRWMSCLAVILAVLISAHAFAADRTDEAEMSAALTSTLFTLRQIQAGGSVADGFARLKALEEQIRVLHLLLEDKFQRRKARVQALVGSSALRRHRDMHHTYQRIVGQFLDTLSALQAAPDLTTNMVQELIDLLRPVAVRKALPIYGSLPYTHLTAAAVSPDLSTSVVPAYMNPSVDTTDADLEPSPMAPESRAIAELAESLEWSPVNIYEWVMNNVTTEWYWGCMKGAEDTLRQKSGNDCDQAALLVALLRAAGYPSRYVRGAIQFYPDLETARRQMGVGNNPDLLLMLQRAGIPHQATFSGQQLASLQIEHIWVETQVPYANYRGAVIDTHGKTWVALDTSIKVDGFNVKAADPMVSQLQLDAIRDLYLETEQTQSPLDYLRTKVEEYLSQTQSDLTYDQLLAYRSQTTRALKILPNALQFDTVQVTAEYTALPEPLIHTVHFQAQDATGRLFYDQSVPVAELSNRQVLLTYEPQTVDDQETINAYGGLDNTPSYLVRLRPVIEVDGRRTVIGSGGLPSGDTFTHTITVTGPGRQRQFSNTHIIGSMALLGIFARQAVMPAAMDDEAKDAARLLHETAAGYAMAWHQAEEELAALLGINLVRSLPNVVTTGGVMEVTQLLDQPHDITWKGVYVDADFRAVETVGGLAMDDGADPQVLFMQLSALHGSYMEGQILESSFQVDGISTARLLGLAADQYGEPVHIDAANVESVLPPLGLAENMAEDIRNAVNQNLTVHIPPQTLTFEDWSGIGYIKENPATGEAGYMLSGMIAGGMTAWRLDRWDDYYRTRMTYSYAGEVNNDPAAAAEIVKITATDMQLGTVGEALARPLQVLVRDHEGKPVVGAEVQFFVKIGGGNFGNGGTLATATTDPIGVASVAFVCGTQTAANPAMWWEPGYTYSQQVGENIVSARLVSTGIELAVPFTEYGFPGEPASIEVNAKGGGSYLTLVFTIFANVLDQYGNPIANENVVFSLNPIERYEDCPNESPETRYPYLVNKDDPCLGTNPVYGQCDSGGSIVEDISDPLNGAVAYYMAGAVPGTNYETVVSCKGISNSLFSHSKIGGNCYGEARPYNTFRLKVLSYADQSGNIITAVPPNSPIPLQAKIFFTREDEENGTQDLNCGETTKSCDAIYGARTWYIDTDFSSADVTFGGQSGTDLGDGNFAAEYVVQKGMNTIDIAANASVPGRRHNNSCADCAIEDYSIDLSSTLSTVVYGVEVVTDTETIDVDVNDLYQATCDISIRYDIQPHEYTAGSAYVFLYRDDMLINVLISEKQGAGFASLARGFQFDDSASYHAEVVLNPGSDFEIKSRPIALVPVPGAVKIERLEIVDYQNEGCLVPIGGRRKIKAVASGSNGIDWTIVHFDVDEDTGKPVKAEIRSLGGASADAFLALITAKEDSGSGWITVRAADKNNPCIYKEAMVYIGCPKCEDGQCDTLPGHGFVRLSSIDIGIGLGPGSGGQPAGQLFVRSEEPDDTLYTPEGLKLSTTTRDIEARYGDDHLLRQVMAPEALVDIQVHGPTIYSLDFYRPEDVSGEQDGLYEIEPAAQPVAIWTLSQYGSDGLKVTESRDGKTKEHIYEWDQASGSWTLSKANGSQILSRQEERSGDDRIVTRIVKDAYGNIASKTRTTYRTFDWGESIVESVIDPDGAALTTTTQYYTDAEQAGSYSRIAGQVDPDGSWTRYEYDDQGRTIARITPWLDAGPGTDPSGARVTAYDYAPVDPDDSNHADDTHRPRTVIETIIGQVVAKTYHAYIIDGEGSRTEISERCAAPDAAYGGSANQRTVTAYHPSDTGAVESGRIHSIVYPDGRMDSYTYGTGTYDEGDAPGLFIPYVGSDERTIVVHGTVDQSDGVAFKTTREVTIASPMGRTLLQAAEVYDGSGYERIDWTIYQYNADGRVIAVRRSDGGLTETGWSCCGKDSETDAQGRTLSYTYDDLGRVLTSTREGLAAGDWPVQSAILTSYTYDALGRTTAATVMAGSLSRTTRSRYDRAGRLESSVDAAGLETANVYSSDGRTTTVTAPGNAVQTTTRHIDGSPASITGTAAAARYYSYGVNADGSRWTEVRTGAADSPMFQRTTTDMLGRTVRNEKQGALGIETTLNEYDAQGRLVRTIADGQADTLYTYDALGNVIQSGLDIDANGLLEPASADRINATDTRYTEIAGQWWQQTTAQVYPTDNDGTPATVSIQRSQLSGLMDDGQASETVAIDIHGNATTTVSLIDRSAKTITQTVDYPDSAVDAETITVNGLTMQTRTKTGLTTTLLYDDLGRRIGATDPRTGTAVTHYDANGRVDYVRDAAGNTTRFGYDGQTGRKITQTDALGKVTRFAYNLRGQVTHTWGDVPYPVGYEYDDQGRMTAMTTFRTDEGFDLENFPSGATGDVTRWHYHPATGLLEAKEYADGSRVTYTYTTAGKLETRTWARQDSGQPLATTYNYDPATAELLLIDYSDATADISFAYDRLGRQREIIDGAGTRSFGYNAALQLETETVTGLYDAVLTRTYESAGVIGRSTGFTLGAGYSVTYGYDTTGRFNALAWNTGGQIDTTTYTYVADSDLLQGYSTASGMQTTYGYEPQRNLKTSVQNRHNAAVISQYDYIYDPIGRRTSAANSGSAFAQAAFSAYDYNDRSELVAADRYLGTDIADTSNPVPAEQRGYLYDPIGNRTQATAAGAAVDYAANALNQYSAVGAGTPIYDEDGNMIFGPDDMAYTYNAENRLIAAQPQSPVEGSTRVEFAYDYLGRRVQKIVYVYGSGDWQLEKEILFVYDGWNVIKEITREGGSDTMRYFVWGLDLSQSLHGAGGVGGLLAMVDGTNTYHYCFDVNGNVGQLVDAANSEIAAHYEFDPFGNIVLQSGSMADDNPFRFSTKYFDTEASLYYYGYRYYLPELGRWISKDPAEENGGLNLYAFVNNSSLNLYDSLGLLVGNPTEFEKALLKDLKITRSLFKKAYRGPGPLMGALYIIGKVLDLTSEEYCLKVVVDQMKKEYSLSDPDTQVLTFLILQGLRVDEIIPKFKLNQRKGLPIYWVVEEKWPRIYLNTRNHLAKSSRISRMVDQLNYVGAGPAGIAQKKKNRAANMALKNTIPGRSKENNSLDEYPVASSMQGGVGASLMWVPLVNQRSQGGVLEMTVYRPFNMKRGDAFLTVIVPRGGIDELK